MNKYSYIGGMRGGLRRNMDGGYGWSKDKSIGGV